MIEVLTTGKAGVVVNGLLISSAGVAIFKPNYPGMIIANAGAAIFQPAYPGILLSVSAVAIFKKES